MTRFPITAGCLAGAPTEVIADSLALGDRWVVCRATERQSTLEVWLARFGNGHGLMAFWLGPAVES